jgi:outer membrane protein assembly factor BamB
MWLGTRALGLVLAVGWAVLGAGSGAAHGRTTAGWLGDGTAVYPTGQARVTWSATDGVAWSTPMPSWGNASPVVVGDQVIVTSEPLTILAVARSDGALRWSHDVSYLDTLTGAERAAAVKDAAEVKEKQATLKVKGRELNRLKRELRKARGGAEARVRTEAITRETGALRERLRELDLHLPPERIPVMGNAPSTPLTDGESIYGVFGNGVVVSFTLKGKLQWGRFLGRPDQNMRGFQRGQAAPPMLVDGLLIVAMNQLYALDPATGAVRWRSVQYLDYGQPAALKIDGVWVLATPKGDIVRASDGKLLLDKVGSVYYRSPIARGRTLWFIGAEDNPDGMRQHLSRVDLLGDVSNLRSKQVYRREIVRGKTYASAVLHEGRIYLLGRMGQWSVIDANSGESLLSTSIDFGRGELDPGEEACFATPAFAGGRIVVANAGGQMAVLKIGTTLEVLGRSMLDGMRATPTFVGKRMFLRTFDRLWAIDAP